MTLNVDGLRALIQRRRQEALTRSARPNVVRLSNKARAAWEAEKEFAGWVLSWCEVAEGILAAGPYDDAAEAQIKALYLSVNQKAPSLNRR